MHQIEPSSAFADHLLADLRAKRLVRAKRRLLVSGILFGLFIISLLPTILSFVHEAEASGFFAYLSLLSSEHANIGPYVREFVLSLLDSVPVFSLALLIAVLGALAASAVSFLRASRESGKFISWQS